MTTYTLNGQPLAYGPFVTGSGDAAITHPGIVLDLWTDAELSAIGVVRGPDPAPTLLEAIARQIAALQTQYDTRRQSPMTWSFDTIDARDGAGVDKGAAGAQQLDVSDASAKNWLTAQAEAAAYIAAGQGTTVTPICAISGLWVQTTAAQVQQVLLTGDGTQTSMAGRGRAMMVRFTALATEIGAAADAAAALAIDTAAGWPA